MCIKISWFLFNETFDAFKNVFRIMSAILFRHQKLMNVCWNKIIILLSCICNDEYTFRGLFLEQTYNFYNYMYMYIVNYIILITTLGTMTLQWHHNERDGVSNHRRLDCLLKRLFGRRSKKTLKLCVTWRVLIFVRFIKFVSRNLYIILCCDIHPVVFWD